MYHQTNCSIDSNNFPRTLTPFVDRTKELSAILERLGDPACRLLTLVGPGGIGKTRLAIQAAKAKAHDYAHGAFFVNLQPVPAADHLVAVLIDTLNFSPSGQADLQTQLQQYLHGKELLLVLDNFEHLLPTAADLLLDLLDAAPDVTVLVTSRAVLNLREEWLFPVPGLPYPLHTDESDGADAAPDLMDYGAVALFVEHAARMRRDFSLEDEREGVVRICRLVEGMPLALELAAAWTKTLTCAAIADEIQSNLEFLATRMHNVPEQHRSIQAVFAQTWAQLSGTEQAVFQQLSVFRGGFDRQAAAAVAGATLPTLSALLDKSLLCWESDGRYHIHELLRQYAATHLQRTAAPADIDALLDRHCAYYADFLQRRAADTTNTRQQAVIREIAIELDNIRAAWAHAVARRDVINLQKANFAYYMFCDFQGYFQEGANAVEDAIAALQPAESAEDRDAATSRLLAELHVFLGWHSIRLGQLDVARRAFETGRALYAALDASLPPGFGTDPRLGLGLLESILGNYATAEEWADAARQQWEAGGDKLNLQIAYYVLENVAIACGDYQEAARYAQRAYVLTRETGNRWMMAYILSDLGAISRALGDYVQARHHFQASYDIKESLDDPEGMAVALTHLAGIACRQESYQQAQELYQQSLAIYQNINDKGGLARTLLGLGNTAIALGKYDAARQHLHGALHISAEIQFTPLSLAVLLGTAELLLHVGRRECGLLLLLLALHHPASEHETKERAQTVLDRYRHHITPEEFAAAKQRSETVPLESILRKVQAELAVPIATADVATDTMAIGAKPDQADVDGARRVHGSIYADELVEQLTARELEVLELIATGLTNKQIADELILSTGTVKWYTGQIYGKLGVRKRTQAVARARELALLN